MIKVVMFDFDDTLCQTEESCYMLENIVAIGMGFSPMNRDIHRKTSGANLKDIITKRIPGVNSIEFIKRHEALFEKYIKDSNFESISNDNLKILKKLKNKNFRLGILTNRTLSETRHLRRRNHPLREYIEVFYCKDIIKHHKPDPRAFDETLKFFNVSPNEVVYVGDSRDDGLAAKGAGLHFIAVMESGIRTKEDFKDIPVDYFAPKLTDIIRYIINYK